MKRAKLYSDQALELIKKYHVVPSPVHYAVLYEYVKGDNAALKQILDDTRRTQRRLQPELLTRLYDEHLQSQNDLQQIHAIRDRMENVIQEVLSEVSHALDYSTGAKDKVGHFSQELASADVKGKISDLAKELQATLEEVMVTESAFQEKLVTSQQEIQQLEKQLEKTKHEAETDELTQLPNRRALNQFIETFADEEKRPQHLHFAIVDVDHFKGFNDQYGHQIGDTVLCWVAQVLGQVLLDQGQLYRYAGDEFCIVFDKELEQPVMNLVETMVATMAKQELKIKKTQQVIGTVTVSVGVAMLRPKEPMSTLVKRADDALYAAKEGGRNQAVMLD